MLATGAKAEDKLKVAWVYVGPIGDHGYSYQHHQSLEAVKAGFSDKVETSYVENVSERPDAERVISQLAEAGNTLVCTASRGCHWFMETLQSPSAIAAPDPARAKSSEAATMCLIIVLSLLQIDLRQRMAINPDG